LFCLVFLICAMILYVSSGKISKPKPEGNAGFSKQKTTTSTKYQNWMKNIPDSAKLSSINIPGTHESATHSVCSTSSIVNAVGKSSAQCQTMDINSQLIAGIRYFDIRVANNGNIVHGKGTTQFKTEYTLDSILSIFVSFLASNPSEAVIMKIKNEEGKGKKDQAFIKLFEGKVSIVAKLMVYDTSIPTLGQVRGKMWLFDDFGYGKGFSSGNSLIIKQNYWKAGWINPEDVKIKKVKGQFKEAAFNKDSGNLYINNLSSNPAAKLNIFKSPMDMAAAVNQVTYAFAGFLGIVVFDFPSEDVIGYVIDQNNNFLKRTASLSSPPKSPSKTLKRSDSLGKKFK